MLARYGLTARQFGRFNGLYLVDRPLPDWPWLANDDGVSRWAIEQGIVSDETWLQITDLYESHPIIRTAWPDDTISRLQRLWQERERFYSDLRCLPKTLVHGDVSRKNLFSRRQPHGLDETVAIDWGAAGLAPIGQEISGLTFPSVSPSADLVPEQLAELDSIIFEAYVQGLHDVGWQGDPRIVRLGYAARTALHFGVMVMSSQSWVLQQDKRGEVEASWGLTAEEILSRGGLMRRFLAERADEARRLMDSLHL